MKEEKRIQEISKKREEDKKVVKEKTEEIKLTVSKMLEYALFIDAGQIYDEYILGKEKLLDKASEELRQAQITLDLQRMLEIDLKSVIDIFAKDNNAIGFLVWYSVLAEESNRGEHMLLSTFIRMVDTFRK